MNSEAWDIQNIKEQQRSATFQQNFAFVSVHPQNVNRKACKLKTPHCTPIHPKIGVHRFYKSHKLSKNSFSFFLPPAFFLHTQNPTKDLQVLLGVQV